MKTYLDRGLKGYAMIFEGPLEVIDAGERGDNFRKWSMLDKDTWSDGALGSKHKLDTWQNVRKAMLDPNPDGLALVNQMLEELRRELPEPKSRMRKKRWSDIEGEIDFDRAMKGESEYMRDTHREFASAPQHVALLCNLDAYAGDTAEKVFWRGAAAIACCDLLENAGYSCEVWIWCMGKCVFESPNHYQFSAIRAKHAGEPLDAGSMVNALSAWFLRTALFGSFWGCGAPAQSVGGAMYRLEKGWRDHMDVTQGVTELFVEPAFTREGAIKVAREMLDKVNAAAHV